MGKKEDGSAGVVIDGDEHAIGTCEAKSVEKEEPVAQITGKRKGNERNSRMKEEEEVGEGEGIQFTGKKKSKSKAKKGGNSSTSLALHADEDVSEEEDNRLVFTGKKKASKSKKGGNWSAVCAFAAIGGEDDDDDKSGSKQQDEEPVICFTGKKKPSKSNKKTSGSVLSDGHLLDEENEKESDGPIIITLSSGKKKSLKKKTSPPDVPLASGGTDEDASVLGLSDEESSTIKKKPSKKKNSNTVDEHEQASTKEADVVSKNKKKKKTGEEEDDLDRILGESSARAPPCDTVEAADEGGEKDRNEEAVESAAAKKKKKKKEKKAKAATDVEEKQVETKSKVPPDKKVPKHVREMQERLAKQREAEEKRKKEEEDKIRKEEEDRLKQEEVEKIAEEKKRLKKEKMLKKKQEGKLLTAKQKEEARRLEAMRNQILANAGGGLPVSCAPAKRPKYQSNKSKPHSNSTNATETTEEKAAEVENIEESQSVEENGNKEWDAKNWDDADLKLPDMSAFDDEEESPAPQPHPKPELQVPKKEIKNGKDSVTLESKKEDGEKTLRSPICCIMGHVDTRKTKLLDCIRRTNVQGGEAGGITQQIGATYIPAENIRERTKELKADATLNVPGLLVIDTPGHESFKNLRSRGSGLCDIAILVVDIMHGLEPQTIESLNLLKMRGTEFIVALNKVDRLYGWDPCQNAPIGKSIKRQKKDVKLRLEQRTTQIITQFKEQGVNTELYNKNKDRGETFSIVPTSAVSGEGIPEMLLLLVQWAQKTMIEKLTYSSDIQVKVIEGLGTTIDVVLVNGVLHQGDEIVVCGFQGPIHTTIRSLLTPHPMKELRVKGAYIHHKEIKAAQGIKITAQNLEHAVAGTSLYMVGPADDLEEIKESVMDDMRNVLSRIDKSGEGVYVQASTLGSLEALLEFLKTPAVNIPVSGIGIGPVHKKDVMKASVMLEKKKEYATILAFDVKVTPEARKLADDLGVKIFIAHIIYHLFDQFKAYIDNLKGEKKKEAAQDAVFPCVLKIMPNCVYNNKGPIILGVDVLEGILKIGTPICIPQREFIDIGVISSIENNPTKPVDYAKKGQKVGIKITGSNAVKQQIMFGRHFKMEDELVSHISRNSIQVLKANYRDELSTEEWKLLAKLKKLFKIL